jgi:TatD DNase family protein
VKEMHLFDSHIHLEKYTDQEIESFCLDPQLMGLIAVSMDLESSQRTLQWKQRYPDKIIAACGFHPEQSPQNLVPLLTWIRGHASEIDAIGEIGLPYYLRRKTKKQGQSFDDTPYLEMLKTQLTLAKELDKPVILHAVYEDASTLCDLLEEFQITKAHFHWAKADLHTIKRMAQQGYYLSFTPDIWYEEETAWLAAHYPLDLIMAETDGPWPFEGPCTGKPTTPQMIKWVVQKLAELRGISTSEMEQKLISNTLRFLVK